MYNLCLEDKALGLHFTFIHLTIYDITIYRRIVVHKYGNKALDYILLLFI
jgi:hypothetical protein